VLCACEIIHVQPFSVVFRVVRGLEPCINWTLGLLLRKHLANGDQCLFKKLRHAVTLIKKLRYVVTDCLKNYVMQ
jgi:hypothetical protein